MTTPAQAAENAACHALIVMTSNPTHARHKCAVALRTWRARDRARAKWFRSHIYRIGYPSK